MNRIESKMMLKATLTALCLSLTSAIPGQFRGESQVAFSGFSGGAQSQFLNQDGVTTGQCEYVDQEGRNVQIEYIQYPDERIEAKTKQSFVADPKAALRECQNQVKAGQNHLEEQLRQDLFGGFGESFGGAQDQSAIHESSFFNSGADTGFPSSFDASLPGQGVIQGSSSFGGVFPSQGEGHFQGSSYFGSNFPSQGPSVFQVSSGDFGAQILVVSQDGVTTGLCSYVDEQGRTIKINYTEYPNGTVKADSQQDFVTDPHAALSPCNEAVRQQQEEHAQQVLQLEKEQQALQDNLRKQQANLQDQLRRQQENLQNELRRQQEFFRKQQQQLQQQLQFQHQNIFGSGQFPFTFPNFYF